MLLRQKLESISETSYVQDLTQLIEAWFSILSTETLAQPKDALTPKVMEYIDENCLNSDLSVTMISDHFGVNSSYLSNCFHSQAGIKMIDYIHQCRLRKVKQLLRETNLSIGEIAECTGYYSAISMSRAFKRYEGITPSAYRNS